MENEPIINATALAQGEEKGGLCIVVYMCMAHTSHALPLPLALVFCILVYGRFAHKDDPLQVSAGRPAPTISPMGCVKPQIIEKHVITCIICIILLALSLPKYDFANTLYASFP